MQDLFIDLFGMIKGGTGVIWHFRVGFTSQSRKLPFGINSSVPGCVQTFSIMCVLSVGSQKLDPLKGVGLISTSIILRVIEQIPHVSIKPVI